MIGCAGRALVHKQMNLFSGKNQTVELCLTGLLFLACVTSGALRAQGQNAWNLNEILKQLDRSAHNFKTLTADVERTKVTVVVTDRSTESGQINVRRDG